MGSMVDVGEEGVIVDPKLRVLTPAPILGVGAGVGVVVFYGGFGPDMPMPMLTLMEPLSWLAGVDVM
jgi:hypothetical protein